MKQLMLAAALALAATSVLADDPPASFGGTATAPAVKPKARTVVCNECGTVQAVRQEKRKGEGGAVGIVGGAVVGGLLGNQIGKGTGRTLATVGGAVAGGYAGNEVQKHATAKQVWVTEVRMKDGAIRTFEQEPQPAWKTGQIVKVENNKLVR